MTTIVLLTAPLTKMQRLKKPNESCNALNEHHRKLCAQFSVNHTNSEKQNASPQHTQTSKNERGIELSLQHCPIKFTTLLHVQKKPKRQWQCKLVRLSLLDYHIAIRGRRY